MLFISIFKRNYKFILGSTALLAAVLFFAAAVLFPLQYESNVTVLIPQQSSTFIPESLKEKKEWILPPVTTNELNRLISDKETQKEVGLRLLAAHLTLHSADPKSISTKHFQKLQKSVSFNILDMARSTDSLTYLNLVEHANTHPDFIELINRLNVPYYSNAAISSVSAARIGDSDMIALSDTSDDAGIGRKTLEIVLEVCMRHYINLNAERNSKIAAYYENRYQNAENEFRTSEENLLNIKHARIANRKNILKQLSAVREKLSESENFIKTIERQLGTQNPVVKNRVVIGKQQVLNSLYNQLITGSNDAKIDTAVVQILIDRAQNDLKYEIATVIAALPGDEETKEKVAGEYGNALVAVERNKAQLAVLERQREALYNSLTKLSSQELEKLETCDQKYLSALDEIRKNNRYQQNQRAILPIQIIEQPNSHAIGNMGILCTILGGIAGFFLSFSLMAARAAFSKKLNMPQKAERMTGLKVAGIIPNDKQLQSCNNANHIQNSLLYQLFWTFFQSAGKQQRVLVTSMHPEDGKTFVCELMDGWLFRKGKECKVVTPCFEKGAWWIKPQNTSSDNLIPIESLADTDVLIMKLPPLIAGKYPVELTRKFNTVYLVCNADREWLPDDSKVVNYFMEQSKQTPQIILNNVDLDVVEGVLGRINVVKTYHASPQRSSQRAIMREHKLIRNSRQAQQIIKMMPNLGLILDKNRQIVYANETISSLLGLSNMNKTLGLRPGELVSCVYSDVTKAGCGTSKACQNCGAVNTIVRCMKSHKPEEGECRINSFMDGQLVPFKFKITCSPFEMNNEFFVITNLADIRGEEDKRRKVIEKAMSNESKGDLSALSDLIGKVDEVGQLDSLMNTLKQESVFNEEIMEHQRLVAAENGELKPNIAPTGAFSILDNVVRAVRAQKITEEKEIALAPPFPPTSITTDAAILEQILRSMLRNAVEATSVGGIIHIGYEKTKYAVTFYVFNEGFIPDEIQSQIFQKEFTTKGKGRGFGAYGMRLLGERYLRGSVGFKSEKSGTRFFITLPMDS
jgi:hypothetical protein